MSIAVTTLYAGILALIYVALAINVTVHRGKFKVPLGDGNNPDMRRMIRVHGNAAEYIPIALLLMLILELNGGSRTILHVAGIALIVARIAQSSEMFVTEMAGMRRIAGQSITWLTIAALAVLNILKAV